MILFLNTLLIICTIHLCSHELVCSQESCSSDNHQATEPLEGAEETSSEASFTSPVLEGASQSALSIELASVFSEASAEPLEEDLPVLEVPSDPCVDITADTNLDETSALNVSRRQCFYTIHYSTFQRVRLAIEEDDSETVAEILCSGLSPNTTFFSSISEYRQTLLHEAAKYDAINSAKVSLDSQTNIDISWGPLDGLPFRFLLTLEWISRAQMEFLVAGL